MARARHPRLSDRQAQGRRAPRRRRQQRAAAQHRDRGGAGRVSAPVRRRRPRAEPAGAAPRGAAGHALAVAVRAAAGRAGAHRHRHRARRHPAASVRRPPGARHAAAAGSRHRARGHRAARAAGCRAHQGLSGRCASRSTTAAIEATVFPLDGIRQAPVSPVDGKPMRRADAACSTLRESACCERCTRASAAAAASWRLRCASHVVAARRRRCRAGAGG